MKRYVVLIPDGGHVDCYADNGVQAREYACYATGLRELPPGTVVIEVRPYNESIQTRAAT